MIAFAKSSELTSGETFIWIVSSSATVGAKFSLTPNSLNCIVTTGGIAPPVPVLDTTGTGNSPPAKKLASLPSRTIRFGSARISSRLFA